LDGAWLRNRSLGSAGKNLGEQCSLNLIDVLAYGVHHPVVPKFWMINDRDRGGVGTSPNKTSEGLTYWVTDKTPLDIIGNWQKVSASSFETQLKATADALPARPPENQSHVTILVHGYNVSFEH
jgi:hypothetical protein